MSRRKLRSGALDGELVPLVRATRARGEAAQDARAWVVISSQELCSSQRLRRRAHRLSAEIGIDQALLRAGSPMSDPTHRAPRVIRSRASATVTRTYMGGSITEIGARRCVRQKAPR